MPSWQHKFAYGFITLWWGSLASIPTGWQICDGTNGTPDLFLKMVIGAGGAYAPGDVGGAWVHPHDFDGDGHSHNIGSGVFLKSGIGLSSATSDAPITGTTESDTHVPPYTRYTYIMCMERP